MRGMFERLRASLHHYHYVSRPCFFYGVFMTSVHPPTPLPTSQSGPCRGSEDKRTRVDSRGSFGGAQADELGTKADKQVEAKQLCGEPLKKGWRYNPQVKHTHAQRERHTHRHHARAHGTDRKRQRNQVIPFRVCVCVRVCRWRWWWWGGTIYV